MRVIFFICLSLMVISKHRFDSTIYPCIVIEKIKILICVAALEALFGPDFDLVTSARFLPKTVLGIWTFYS